jgi:hypothetical protein
MSSRDDRKGTPGRARDDRLKAALKANMARRKAQAVARAAGGDRDESPATGSKGQDDG